MYIYVYICVYVYVYIFESDPCIYPCKYVCILLKRICMHVYVRTHLQVDE